MTRITKEPEVRKQEILDAAMELFYQNGYDKTSITDIAERIGIAQGLCYRYFKSKEELFDTALDYYAQQQVNQMQSILCDTSKTLRQKLYETPTFMDIEQNNRVYYKVCHGTNSKKIHDQLSMKICHKLVPILKEQIQREVDLGELHFTDSETAASFCIYGQLGILLRDDLSGEERLNRIRTFLLQLFEL
ncbi:TetR/AcrR family transcriptional regulator [Sinanaerobacter sp. ZZT-01]|uniref:TetR/AcrR family transcriptional regulator n=1 Tax=Sinanaerobacter sp. ZZT-01 TaxID=3111540 RepID=UPI002D766349|nr:TetR/AcrR family transcriptional regulator [Sinanaerobacter sp. ZZT-01]WRR92947.1 TetR/AcrR family transcriptional regulator [Sinanaerobacter sp. ZZT-01]